MYLNHFAATRNSYKIVNQLYFNLKKKLLECQKKKKKNI